MSEDTAPVSSEENTASTEATAENTAEKKKPAEKKQKPEPPQYKTQVVYRCYNGEWDEYKDQETIDKEPFFKVFHREMTKDGELISETEYDQDGNEIQRSVNTFNENGKVIRHELYNEGYLAEKILFEYDEKNRVSKETREFDEGFPLTTLFTYDDQDRVIEKRVDDSDGELQKRETFEYSPQWKDRVVKHVVYDEEGEVSLEEENEWEEREGEVKPKQMITNDKSLGQYRRTEFFDPRSREDNIVYATYNEKNKVVEYLKAVFDENDREIEEHSVSVNDSDNFSVYYTYDDYDRVIAQEQKQADKIINKINRRYSELGFVEVVAIRSFSRGAYVDYFEYELHS